jgi:hypothetical protein
LRDEIVVIILSILTHYTLEFGKDMGDYECPVYCEVKHEHKISKEKLNDWNNGYNNVERQEEEHLYGTEWDDKYTSSE